MIYQNIWIGGSSRYELLQKLHESKVHLNEYAHTLINHRAFEPLPAREKIKTVEISVCELGLPDGAITEEIYQKAQVLGFKLCPAELAIYLRLQTLDPAQPIDPAKGNWRTVAMQTLSDDPDFPRGFYLRHREDGFWLRGYRASSDHKWDPADRFIFVV